MWLKQKSLEEENIIYQYHLQKYKKYITNYGSLFFYINYGSLSGWEDGEYKETRE